MEYLIEGAPVYVMDAANTIAEAMVFSGGKVLAVGDRHSLRERFARARRLPADGSAIIPAFNDCHAHLLRLGQDMTRADLRYCRTVQDIKRALWANDLPRENGWLIGVNYDQNILPGRFNLGLDELDSIGGDRPIYLFHLSRHEGMANSKALSLANITSETPDPPEGKIERDESGRPTGRLLEMAVRLAEDVLPEPSDNELENAIQAALEHQAKMGVLSATDATSGKWFGMEREWSAYSRVLSEKSPVKVTLMPDVEVCLHHGWMDRECVELPPAPRGLRLGPMKIIADGAITNQTAAVSRAYVQGGFGFLIYPEEDLKAMIIQAHRGGWRCAVHAIGDRTIDICLAAFAQAESAFPRPGVRHRLEHCMVVNDRINRIMAQYGVIPCPQPEFIYHLGHAYRRCLAERADSLMPYRSWLRAGLTPAFGSDQPIVTGNPILGWKAAVERRTRDGDTLGAEERLEPLEALRAYTATSALACGDEDTGSLEPGKEARFVVLSHDPESILNNKIHVVTTSVELLTL
jgi:predicted amidohydrolase YtcJ